MSVKPIGDWADQAACKGMESNLWFPARGGASEFALDVCSMCPVKVECGEYAIPDPGLQGIWGGMMKEQRDRIRSRRNRRMVVARDARFRAETRPTPWRDREPLTLEQRAAQAAFGHRS
jgi:WhiB family redox-sensing transcriptional regulator